MSIMQLALGILIVLVLVLVVARMIVAIGRLQRYEDGHLYSNADVGP